MEHLKQWRERLENSIEHLLQKGVQPTTPEIDILSPKNKIKSALNTSDKTLKVLSNPKLKQNMYIVTYIYIIIIQY